MTPDKKHNSKIRKRLKRQRRNLSEQQLIIAQRRLSLQLRQHLPLLKAKKIASYLPSNGEISPLGIHKKFHRSRIFLPRITHFNSARMAFYPSKNKRLKNRYNIVEPLPLGTPTQLISCDIILVPLVAFDRQGNRIGMGAGFYDRALSFKQHNKMSRPLLIGLAHHFQEVDNIRVQDWDIPLDAILTDHELIKITL